MQGMAIRRSQAYETHQIVEALCFAHFQRALRRERYGSHGKSLLAVGLVGAFISSVGLSIVVRLRANTRAVDGSIIHE